MFFESFLHHIVRNDGFKGFKHRIHGTFPYEIVLYKDGYASLCRRSDIQICNVFFMPVGQERNVKFRDNGISAVAVHYPDKGFYTACLIDMVSYVSVLAEVHRAVRHAMSFPQYPHLFGRKASACYYLLCLTALRREICHKLFYIDRYFEYSFPILRQCGNGYVDVPETKLAHEGGVFLLVNKEIYIRMGITEMMYEVRHQVRSYGGEYANSQTSFHRARLVRNKFLYSLRLVKGYLCLTYYL